MKTRRKRKIVAILTSFVVAVTMMQAGGMTELAYGNAGDPPAPEGSITWGLGDSDEESASKLYYNYTPKSNSNDRKDARKINWIKYKNGDYAGYDFIDRSGEYGLSDKGITQDDIAAAAKYEMKSWTKIASKIFKSGALTGGGTTNKNNYYGATSATAYHDWNYYYETDRPTHGQYILTDWLASSNPRN